MSAALPLAIVCAFPFLFAAIWSFVSAILAFGSGYRSLLARFADASPGQGGASIPALYARVGFASYRGGALGLDASPAGLGLRVARIFPFHPPVRVPWDRVAIAASGAPGSFFHRVDLDDRVALYVPLEAARAIAAQKARFGG